MAERPEHPPNATGGRHRSPVVGNDVVAIGDAEFAHRGGKRVGVGKHMGQWVARVADGVDIEMDGARKMRGGMLHMRITIFGRHIPGSIDDLDVRIVKMRSEPAA